MTNAIKIIGKYVCGQTSIIFHQIAIETEQ